jgi:hypothetical protein
VRFVEIEMNPQFQTLADSLYWERVERARRLTPEQRLVAGPELFDYACTITLSALREQMPGACEAELLKALRRRLAVKRNVEDIAA